MTPIEKYNQSYVEMITGGRICLVTHIGSEIQFAWKETVKMKGEEEKGKEEARIAQELHSPFIVEIVDSFYGGGLNPSRFPKPVTPPFSQ
jgi:hypothetical protein